MQKPPVNAQKAKCHGQTNQSTDRRTRNSRVHMTKKNFSISFLITIINAPFLHGAKQMIISNIWGIG